LKIYKVGLTQQTKEIYDLAINKFNSGSFFIEVGSYKGKSSCAMAVNIINSKKDIKFYCVDTWKGSPEHQQGELWRIKML
jgi:hypothetical protein